MSFRPQAGLSENATTDGLRYEEVHGQNKARKGQDKSINFGSTTKAKPNSASVSSHDEQETQRSRITSKKARLSIADEKRFFKAYIGAMLEYPRPVFVLLV